ncbi:MAG: hypothetical protein P8X39_12970, partial [Desulfofustis sp.]
AGFLSDLLRAPKEQPVRKHRRTLFRENLPRTVVSNSFEQSVQLIRRRFNRTFERKKMDIPMEAGKVIVNWNHSPRQTK